MDRDFYQMDLDKLQAIYQNEVNYLKTELLKGSTWESMKEQKNKVTELAIIIHKKRYPLHFNPAEFVSPRNQKDDTR